MIARGATDLLLPYVGPDNIWRGYSGENVIYDGIPRAGLVAYHDLYDPTASLVSVPDLSGNGYALQLGSAAGADTNDPAWGAGGKGLVFTTDDYALTGNLSGVTMAGDWTAIVLALAPASAAGFLWSLGSSDNDRQSLYLVGTNIVQASTKGDGSTALSGNLARDTNTPGVLTFCNSPSGVTVTRLDTGAYQGVADKNPTGTPHVCMGKNAGGTTYLSSGVIYAQLLYSRVLTIVETQCIHRALKATWAARGVTIL